MKTRNEHTRLITAINSPHAGAPGGSVPLETASLNVGFTSARLPLRSYLNTRGRVHFEAMFSPLGFPVRLLSNSPDILSAANQSWSSFEPAFHRQPLEILLDVNPDLPLQASLPPAPEFTQKGGLVFQIADIHNFFVADLNRGRALCMVNETTASSPKYLRYHFLETAALLMISTLRAVPVHAACVRVHGKGILLCGDSGAGKSTLAFAGAQTGWWTYVTDDASYVPMDCDDRMVLGNCSRIRFRPSAAEFFPELAGRAVTPRAEGKPSIEVHTSEWPAISTTRASFVDHIVFLNRKYDHKAPALVSLPPSTVWPWLRRHVLSTSETLPRQEAAFSRLLRAGLHELRYSDLSSAIERINLLAKKGN